MGSRWPVEHQVLVRVHTPLAFHTWTVWRYRAAADPYAVHVDLGEDAVWSFARELLARGLTVPAGLGDVQVFRYEGRIAVALESPDGRAILTARAADLRRFLDKTYAWVPAGEEPAYVDVAVASLLGEAGRC